MTTPIKQSAVSAYLPDYVLSILNALYAIADSRGADAYVCGGAVRDVVLKRRFSDIDITVTKDAADITRELSTRFKLPVVILDDYRDIIRIVVKNTLNENDTNNYSIQYIDISALRDGAKTIDKDLIKRDFTINAVAMPLKDFMDKDAGQYVSALIDPTGGINDIMGKMIRHCSPRSFYDDPLRIIRAFRFMACLGFEIEADTKEAIRRLISGKGALERVAPERIFTELSILMRSDSAGDTIRQMDDIGLLTILFPEMEIAKGVTQPGFHHLDVYEHLLECLCMAELIINREATPFRPHNIDIIARWLLSNPVNKEAIKLSSLFHDIGKPLVKGQKAGRATFYNHDKTGARLVRNMLKRLRYPNAIQEKTVGFVSLHMRPFHLLNDLQKKGGPSVKAMRKFINSAKGDFIGLFLLAMADTMAGKGPLRPDDLEEKMDILFEKIYAFWIETLRPIRKKKRLLTGNDVMKILNIPQGPAVGRAIEAVEEALCENKISSRDEAIIFLKQWHKTGDD